MRFGLKMDDINRWELNGGRKGAVGLYEVDR